MQNSYIIEGVTLLITFGAFYIKKRKAYWLISGYTSMSEEKRKFIDWQGFANLMFYTFLVVFFLTIINFLFLQVHNSYIIYSFTYIALITLSVLFLIIYGRIKYDYSKKGGLPTGIKAETKTVNKKLFWGVFSSIVILSFVPFLFLHQPPDIKLENKILHINSIWGGDYLVSDIQKIDTLQKLPKIKIRTNGYAWSNILKGNFELDSLGSTKLFLICGTLPYVYIETKDKQKIIFNTADANSTRTLFLELNKLKE